MENDQMPEPVRIDLPRSSDAEELVEFLDGQGFATTRRKGAINVQYAEPDRLTADVDGVIADWLADGERDLVPVRVGSRRVALRPPAG
jgi:hypothetical protein